MRLIERFGQISFKAIVLIVFAVIVSLTLMVIVWRIVGNLEVDDHDHKNDDPGDA